jgi:flagellar hook-associated protein 3 FlgL
MPNRITQGSITNQLLRNLSVNMRSSSEISNQMATGRKINKPSDDPVGITYSLRYRTDLSVNEQYTSNANTARSWLDYNDTILGQAGDVLKRAKELTVQGATGTNPQVALDSIRNEISQLRDQMLSVANSTFRGKYIYNGQIVDQKPYDSATAASKTVDDAEIKYAVGAGIELPVNISGNSIFGKSTEPDNIFKVLDNIMTSLTNGDHAAVSGQLANIDSRMDKMLTVRAEVGARTNRIDLIHNRLDDLGINLTDLQSKTEDVDYAELMIRSKVNENIYQASLSVGAKIIQPSLVDFIR